MDGLDRSLRDALENFRDDLRVVCDALVAIQLDHELWRALNDNLNRNPHAGRPGDVMNFITRSHLVAFGVALRRQLDLDKKCVSLATSLRVVADGKLVFAQDDFVAMYERDQPEEALSFHRQRGISDFSRLAGCYAIAYYPKERARRHLDWLTRRGERVREYVNQTIAHSDRRALDCYGPSIHHYERLLWVMQRLWEHYYWLATGSTSRLGEPLLGSGWKDALRRPWIVHE